MNIVIEYEGDNITADVVFSSAYFLTRTDGNVGEASFRVRDKEHVYPRGYFHTGGVLSLKIDGELEWRGWVMAAAMTWAFPVDNTVIAANTPRFWNVNGVDLNILMQRRSLYHRDTPADPRGFTVFPAGTSDRDVITAFLTSYVDLTEDDLLVFESGIPSLDFIQEIGSPGTEEDFSIASVASPLATMFSDICGQTGGVFYITPDGYIIYADDETVTAPYVLTDWPQSDDEVGYREMNIESKGEALANDALVWGAGRGSADPVFFRYEDEDSIALHGRMQWGDQYQGASLVDTVQRRASTYVLGSPLSRRGHKDDQDFVTLTVFHQGFKAGQVVDFHCETFDYVDTVPIRSSRMSFPTPTAVKWELSLSHQLDIPFARVDTPDDVTDPPPEVGECDDIRPASSDTFTRTVSQPSMDPYTYNLWDEWGEWRDVEPGPGQTWAHGEFLILEAPVDPFNRWAEEWWSDLIFDDPGSPGYGNTYPATPPPTESYTRHAGFRRYRYNSSLGSGWGTAVSGETWEVVGANGSRPVSFVVDGDRGVYDVQPYSGSGSTQEAGIRLNLGTPSYPVELYFENQFGVGRLPGTVLTSGLMEWSFGTGGTSAADSVQMVRFSDADQKFYLKPAGTTGQDELDDYGLIDATQPFAIRVRIEEITVYAKVWQLSDDEPLGWNKAMTRSGAVQNTILVRASSATTDVLYYMDNLQIVGFNEPEPCVETIANPFDIEDVPTLDGDVWHTAQPYEPGTLRVFVSGQEIFAFTETDPGLREFTIESEITGDVTCRYTIKDRDVVPTPGTGDWDWPVAGGHVTQEYGCTGFYLEPARGTCAHFHDGIDIADIEGTHVLAPTNGVVQFYDWSTTGSWMIAIDSDDGHNTSMGHMQPYRLVNVGDRVTKGQHIGFMGSTGNSTGPHTHWQINIGSWDGASVDPRSLL